MSERWRNAARERSESPRTGLRIAAIALLLILSALLQVWRDRGWRPYEPATPVTWLRADPLVGRLSLGFGSLFADLYWIRAVVYFGSQRRKPVEERNYDRLHPMLELATTLDPRFTIAYRFGAIFLSEPPPGGPGRPDLAIELLEHGMQASPDRWEYAHAAGFVHYWARRDFVTAASWMERAARIEGSPVWLKSTAALMREQAGDRAAARLLWRQLAASADAAAMTELASLRLAQLDALDALEGLNAQVRRFEATRGRRPRGWWDLRAAGLVREEPVDPAGVPFLFDAASGEARLSPASPLSPLPAQRPPALP